MQLSYTTGRDYGAPQVLEIHAHRPAGADDFELIPADFVDAVRGIAGYVNVFAIECTPGCLGDAVLREYDYGRYTLA